MSKKIGSIHDFYEWVKGRNPTETYDYFSNFDCAIARYCRDRGVEYNTNPTDLKEHLAQQPEFEPNNSTGRGLTMAGLRREIEDFLCQSPSL